MNVLLHSVKLTLAAAGLLVPLLACAQARMDVIQFSSRVLRGNPLHDPAVRRVAVFVPDQFTHHAALPIVYYLPGYDSSSEDFIKDADSWRVFTQKLADEVTPVLLVAVDGRNRWGGSQYLNSPAQGNYADYVCHEIVSRVESRYGLTPNQPRRIIAGNSSGGFGALRLGMLRPDLFAAVIALSPDSDFPYTHLPLVKRPGVTNASLARIKAYMAPRMTVPFPKNGDLTYALGLSAAYAPVGPDQPGKFQWLFDAKGRFRERVWQLWLDNDPLTIVRRDPNAFHPNQSVYLDGAAHDQFGANVGARKIYQVLRHRAARCAFYEPPGRHMDHLQARLQRGLAWVFHRHLQEIK